MMQHMNRVGGHLDHCYGTCEYTALFGTSSRMHCNAPNSWSEFTVAWEVNGEILLESNMARDSVSKYFDDGKYKSFVDRDMNAIVLEISNISFKDAGTYTCVVYANPTTLTNQVLQVQTLPEMKSIRETQGNAFTAECCAQFALKSNQTEMRWTVEGSDELTITYAPEGSTNSNSRMELCSIVNVTMEIIRHEARLICLTASNQLNTSTSLGVFDLYLNDIRMLTSLKLEVPRGENATIECQTGVSNTSLVHLQLQRNREIWIKVDTTPKRVLYRGDLFLYRFDIDSPEEGTYRCILDRGDGRSAESDICLILVKECGVDFTSAFFATCGFVICAILIFILIIRGPFRFSIPVICERRKTKYNLSTPADLTTRSMADQHCGVSRAKQNDNYNYETNSRLSGEDLTLTKRINQGSRRTRWNGLIFKGSKDEQAIHACTSTAASVSEDNEWTAFSSSIASLPQHCNILETIEVLKKEGVIYCIQVNSPFGSLRQHLEVSRQSNQLPMPIQIASYAHDVLSGVNFLHTNGWLHPGLCARKVLVTNNTKTCKLYDFCLKRYGLEVVRILTKQRGITVNFAPEAVHGAEYTEKCDVWAIGVLLWEIFSIGSELPVYDIRQPSTSHSGIKQLLPMPENCQSNIYEEIAKCWQMDNNARPSLGSIERTIRSSSVAYSLVKIKE